MTNNLTDVLGILIAFITVILLYSMIVTTLVQATQALFRTRARNLRNGLANILESVKEIKESPPESKKVAATNALKVLNKSDAAMLGNWKKPTDWFAKTIGPQVSWLEPGELNQALKASHLNLSDEQLAKIALKYRAMDKPLKKVFLRQVRIMTIFWALIIAVSYQLSTPHLLKRFSAEPEFRDSVAKVGGKLVKKVDEASGDETDKPEETDAVANKGEGKEAVIETQTQQENPQGDDQGGNDKGGENKEDESADGQQTGEGSGNGQNDNKIVIPPLFDFDAWADGEFYASENKDGTKDIKWNSIFGVLLTVILLTLGAPFWFNILKQVVNLRDTLNSASTADKKKGNAGGPNETLLDQQIAMLNQEIARSDNPVMTVSLQNKLDDLRVAKAKIISGT